MNEDTIRLVTIGRILRRRWRLLAVLAVAGALFGYGTSVLLLPPRYTAEASVLLPGQWEERELLTQVDIATSSAVVDRAADALDWRGVNGTELQKDVSAKADDGNIIKVSGTADTPERAQRLSDQLAQQFVTFATRIAGGSTDPAADTATEALRKQVAETNRRITDLADSADPGQTVESVQARTELEGLRTGLQDAMKKLEEANPASAKASMVVMGRPRPTGAAAPTRTQLIVAGALLFFVLAIVGHLAAARVSRRLRTEPEIAAALGSPFLGTVDVPGERHGHRPESHGSRARLRRLLGIDTQWDTPAPQRSGDEAERRLRYRRVCTRLRDQLPAPGGCWSSYRKATRSPGWPPDSSSPRPPATRGCGWWRSRWTGRSCRTATPSPVPSPSSAPGAGPPGNSPASPRRARTAATSSSASSSPARSAPDRPKPPTGFPTTPL